MRKQIHWLSKRRGLRGWSVVLISAVGIIVLGAGAAGALINLGSSSPTASSATAINLQKGLVASYPFNGNAKDATPYANNGTVSGATLTTDRKGKANSAYSFNGSNATISASSTYGLSSTSASIDCWVYVPSTSDRGSFVKIGSTNGGSGGNGNGYAIGMGGSTFDTAGDNLDVLFEYTRWIPTSATLSVGWHNVALVINSSGTPYVYLDGTLVGSYSGANALAPTGQTNIGGYSGAGGSSPRYFTGSVDDVKIYNRPLSAAEITAVNTEYNESLKLDNSTGNLVSEWKMQGNFKDSSPQSNNGVGINNPTLTTDRKGATNAAYSFNGTNQYMTTNKTYATIPNYTYTAWVKLSSSGGPIITRESSTTGSSANYDNELYVTNSGNIIFGDYQGGTSFVFITSPRNYIDNTWHFIAATQNGTALTLYIDGQLIGNATGSGYVQNYSGYYRIAGGSVVGWPSAPSGANPAYLGASMSDVRIYSSALSAAAVSSLYANYNSQVELGGSGLANSVSLGKGLVDYYSFNGNEDDDTPYARNLRTDVGVNTSYSYLTADREGRASSALYTDLQPNQNTDNPLTDSTTGTWSVWIKPLSDSAPHATVILSKALSSSSTCGITLIINTNGTAGNDIKDCSYLNVNVSCPTTYVMDGKWHLVTLTFAANVATCYVDGVSGGTTTFSSYPLQFGGEPLYIGCSPDSYWTWYNGYLDDIRIYNRVLSQAEVTALYNSYD
jgi:hypothetical protein